MIIITLCSWNYDCETSSQLLHATEYHESDVYHMTNTNAHSTCIRYKVNKPMNRTK